MSSRTEVYSPQEIARAAGVAEERVREILGTADGFVPYADALRLARELRSGWVRPAVSRAEGLAVHDPATRPVLFSVFGPAARRARPQSVPLAVSGTIHAGIVAL